MFFSRLAVVLAIVTCVLGVFSVLLGTAATMDLLNEAVRGRYVIRSPEQMIFGGVYGILASAALGALARRSVFRSGKR
jgi:hypothetical protein